ncbi:MAG: energy-coupling factor ABC transporter permease [Pirellulales bacterium]
MHLSNGFLDVPTALFTTGVAAGSVGVSIWQFRRQCETSVPTAGRMAVVGAAVFAAQAVNFPLAAGVSGHLLGGVAAAALLGPWAGILVVSAVLAVQCLLLGDGGLSALGANVLNMAILGALLGYPVWRMRQSGVGTANRAVFAAGAGLASLPLGAVACAVELQFAGRADFLATAGQMVPLHLLLGVAEGLFTAAGVVLMTRSGATAVKTTATDSAANSAAARRDSSAMLAILATVAILVPCSSTLPDTLESAASRLGVVAREPFPAAAVADHAFLSVGGWAGAVLPIALGALLASAAIVLFSRVLVDRGLRRSAALAPKRRVAR